MTCMCGDACCPSCGPAQGYDPERECVEEFIAQAIGDLTGEASAAIAELLEGPGISQEFRNHVLSVARRYQKGEFRGW